MQKIGFIGGGNMATALIIGMSKLGVEIAVSDPNGCKAEVMQHKDNIALASWADLIVLAVKPHIMAHVMQEIALTVEDKPVLSIAAGITTDVLRSAMPSARIFRCMPNTPAMVGQGVTILCKTHTFLPEEQAFVRRMMSCVGQVVDLEENLMSIATAVSGTGPAYLFMIIEAMADAGVRYGLPRVLAYQLAAQTVIGAGTMVRDTGRHPAVLKDEVCSPMGMTIVAVDALEHAGVRAAMMDAVTAAYQKAKEMQ